MKEYRDIRLDVEFLVETIFPKLFGSRGEKEIYYWNFF